MSRLLLLLVVLSSSASVWSGDRLIAISPSQRAALRIATTPIVAHAGALNVGLPAQVTIPPAQERVVSTPLAGVISEIRVAPGDAVRAGQTLAIVRSEALIGAQRELAQAALQSRLAEDTARRDEALFKEGIIAESRLLGAKSQQAQARSALNGQRAWLRLMGLNQSAIQAAERGERLADSVSLAAPISGVVLEQTAVTGARVDGASALFKVGRLDPLWLEIQAPAEIAAQVKIGQKVIVPGIAAGGSVVTVGRGVSAAQTVSIRARISNPNGLLRLNQSVSARIEDVAGAKQWRVPVKAIARQAGKSWVFVERPGGFEPEQVKVLSQSAQSVAIDTEFSGNEKIAVEGVAALKAAWQGEGN